MAPPVDVLNFLIAERQAISDTLKRLDAKVSNHATTPIDEVITDRLILKLTESTTSLEECHKKIHKHSPDDMSEHTAAYWNLLDFTDLIHSGLTNIKASFAVTTPQPIIHQQSNPSVQLPKLQIPNFSGDFQEWTSFRDIFNSSIHNNVSISNVQKLTYLKSYVKGDAARLVQSMNLTDSNYVNAWQLLHDRYENQREIVLIILKRLHSQSMPQPSSTTIRSLIDTTKECLRSLESHNLKSDVLSDAMVFYIILTKLDTTSRQLWEQGLTGTAIPKLADLFQFLEQRARALSSGPSHNSSGPSHNSHRSSRHDDNPKRVHAHHGQSNRNCNSCNKSFHPLYKCDKFVSQTISQKYDHLKEHNRCFNCLNEGHQTARCSSTSRCKSCNGKHHSILHNTSLSTADKTTQGSNSSPSTVKSHHIQDSSSTSQGLLATALVQVFDQFGNPHICRAFLDGGSTASFITNSCVQKLGLQKRKSDVQITGLSASTVGRAQSVTSVSFSPHFTLNNKKEINALVLSKVTESLPVFECDTSNWSHLENLTLADPQFHKPAAIDILLGSDVFWELLRGDRIHGPKDSPLAISSALGWLVAGGHKPQQPIVRAFCTIPSLDSRLQAFWEIESIPNKPFLTAEEKQCENHFFETHTRDSNGRFHVKLPFKHSSPILGSSRIIASRRLKSLERRLEGNPNHKQEYQSFMNEYIQLGHMTLVNKEEMEFPKNPTNFIPHHFVLKEESTTTKFRVVFDASASSSTGVSLNDLMLVGPSLQDNLTDLIMRFRIHPFAFTADIEKMYRQIKVSPEDADLQRILWRESPEEEIKEYRLNTVTYGTASAPYLAVKVLHQLAEDEGESLPLAKHVAKKSFHVDDVLSSHPDIQSTLKVQSQLLEMMRRGCLSLRKWASNSPEVLAALPEELKETKFTYDINLDPSIKTLGIRWNTNKDQFEFRYLPIDSTNNKLTKRIILSEMSKLFDPLGWLSPIIICAKILMQTLWKLQSGWDDSVPKQIEDYWVRFKTDLQLIDQIFIPRCLVPCASRHLSLAGFCDASEKAYGGVIYLIAADADHYNISLLVSKTRVAPTKQISLPRLELCGALLLSNLMDSVHQSLDLPIDDIKAWTDSTVVLAWLKSNPSRWKTFVANRVTQIQEIIPFQSWNHVPGTENPADCCSRGLTPSELIKFPLWWNGPLWLSSTMSHGHVSQELNVNDNDKDEILKEERKESVAVFHTTTADLSILNKYSSLTKLIRVSSWILRFIKMTKSKSKIHGPLTPTELDAALHTWIRQVQIQEFNSDYQSLFHNKPLSPKSRLLTLHPFIDECGLIRVGGRIRNSQVPNDQKTPILLPRHSILTTLIIRSKHLQHLHAGPTLLLSILGQKYWILRARDAVRFLIKKCVICCRQSATLQKQFMAELPSTRLTPCRAFKRVGVDYAGPFLLRPDLPRSKTTIKAYLSLFVCFTTRAFHLEVVSSLSTDAFIAALRRFVSRRGRPTDIHSDCGTNFVGANRELEELRKLVTSNNHNNEVANVAAKDGITWHFNPPGAPHFGGLWEAGVKSVKFHLYRIIGHHRLTFEELTTVMTQIEACLNSRPLTQMSSDPSDLVALTSGHFLVHEPLLTIPEPDLTTQNQSRLSRWQLLQSFQQQFWKRWSREFLSRLQQRPKWLKHRTDLQINDLVAIKDDNLPPQMWKLGRVITLHPGADSHIRVVTLRTQSGDVKRPIHKLCLLPIMTSDIDNPNDDIV